MHSSKNIMPYTPKRLVYDNDVLDELFPADCKNNYAVQPSDMANAVARVALGANVDDEIKWHAPPVFNIRYGSSYVATASFKNRSVQFHSDEGNFEESDIVQ